MTLFNWKHKKDASQRDLAWVDEFIANVRPYIFVREEDCLLIKRPNQAQKLNASGAKILRALLSGMPVARLRFKRSAARIERTDS